MTGLTRKEVKGIREKLAAGTAGGTWLGKLNLPTQILHYWHNDADFCEPDGKPRALPAAGSFPSFNDLVGRYAGDIPPGAMRVELMRAGGVVEDDHGRLIPTRRHYIPQQLDENLLHSMFFSLTNLATTLEFNASERRNDNVPHSRYERYVWAPRLSSGDARDFRALAEEKSMNLLTELDEWISESEKKMVGETMDSPSSIDSQPTYGVGIYFFETEPKSARRTTTDTDVD